MRVWRIGRAKYPPLSGEGARRLGGRWNSPGTPVVYTASSRPLAMLEVLAHMDPDTVPSDYRFFEIEIPDDIVPAVTEPADLPLHWKRPNSRICRQVGRNWIAAGKEVVPRVPSALLPEEYHYLINPNHPSFDRISVVSTSKCRIDPRLLKGRNP